MRFDELYSFAVGRNKILLSEAYDITTGDSVLKSLQRLWGSGSAYDDPYIITSAYYIANTTGTGVRSVAKGSLPKHPNDCPIINVLCWYINWLNIKHPGAIPTGTGTGLRTFEHLVTAKDDVPMMGNAIAVAHTLWNVFVLPAENNEKYVDTIKHNAGNFRLWYDEVVKNRLIHGPFSQKFNEIEDTAPIVEELKSLSLQDACISAIAAHYNDATLSLDERKQTYSKFIDVLLQYPQRVSLSTGADGLFNQTIATGWFKNIKWANLAIRKLGINIKSDEPSAAQVQENLARISVLLMNFVLALYAKYTGSSPTPVAGSNTFTTNPAAPVVNKTAATANEDAAALRQMYIDILQGKFVAINRGHTPINIGSKVTTVHDMLLIEDQKLQSSKDVDNIISILGQIAVPLKPASIVSTVSNIGSAVYDAFKGMQGKI